MKRALSASVLGLVFLAGIPASVAAKQNTPVVPTPILATDARGIVTTTAGQVAGYIENDIYIYKGIPYAKARRFMPPTAPDAWQGIRSSRAYGPTCPQAKRMGWYSDELAFSFNWDDGFPDEDCLRVNVWTPGVNDQKKRPVMVWLHGGGYSAGSGQELPSYDGTNMAKEHDVVVVTLNHRLNVLGFLDLSSFGAKYAQSGNVGLLDLVAALQWVHHNIAAFGGDPANVTIFGQSAGAGSVLAQICSPLNRGLFQRAIMQSGAGLGMFNRHQQSLEDGHRTAERLFEALGVSSLDEARQVPAAELLAAAEALPVPPESGREGDWSMMVNWVPCVDGRFITDQYARTIARGEQNEVEILLGNTTGEFMETDADGTLLPAGEVGNLKLIAEWIRGGRKAPYYYRFDVAMPGDDAGAFHSSELWFSFGTLATCWRPFVGWHYDLSRRMVAYWTNFAATGDPNGPDADGTPLPEWTRYAPFGGDAMRLGQRTRMIRDWSTNVERNALLQWGGAAAD